METIFQNQAAGFQFNLPSQLLLHSGSRVVEQEVEPNLAGHLAPRLSLPWLVGTLRVPSGITWPGTLLLPALGTGHLAGAVWSGGTSGLPPSGAGQRPARAPPGTPLPLTKTQHQPHRASHTKHMPVVNKLISEKYSLFRWVKT